MRDKTFVTLAGLFFLILFAGGTMVMLNQAPVSILRAKNEKASALKSFVVIFPQIASVGSGGAGDTPQQLKVTVTIRDVSGIALEGRNVSVASPTHPISIAPSSSQTTNENGQAQFLVSSTKVGKTTLEVRETISGITLVHIPTIEFVR